MNQTPNDHGVVKACARHAATELAAQPRGAFWWGRQRLCIFDNDPLAERTGLREATFAAFRDWLVATGIEEVGSATSRGLIEAEARDSVAVLVFEPALPGGVLKTARKGVGTFRLEAHGIPAHAGIAPQRSYAFADAASIQALLGRAGVMLPAAAAGAELSTGAVVERVSGAVQPITCGL